MSRPGNTNRLTHGARSPRLIKARARAHRRRFLRQAGLRASDLDPITIAYLEGWARSLAKIDAYDEAETERDPREYHAALNSARLWMAKLETRMKELGIDRGPANKGSELDRYLRETYGGEKGGKP
ncbi:MAG: hypothetical protein ABSC36_03270 [Gaiellaceae bacterium]